MKALLRKIRQILRDRRTRRFLTRVVSGIAAVVVFVTTYALVLPAITMESQAQCGIEAHQHDDSCYSEDLICGQEESEGHHHTEDCYTVTRNLICTIEEHQHSPENGCFAEDGSLICTLEEHTHADACYEESRELTCGLEETEGHHHTDSCYEKVLTCGKEVHIHSAECYRDDQEIQSAAVASTGMTSAAAEIEDDNAHAGSIMSQADEISEVSDSFSSGSDKTGPDDKSASGNTFEDFIYAGDTDTNITDADNSADTSGKNTDNHKDTEMEEEEEDKEDASSYSTGFAADEDAENGDVYIPDKDALDFYTVLNGKTGIYYHHVEEDEDLEDSSAITDWTRADEDTELNPGDIIRVYLSYTLPKDTINATNDISRYRLPDALHLTDDQIEAINSCENGISLQYIDYGNLEITDPERHAAYLGLESVEGSRRPDQEPDEDSQEYISAVVRAEKIYDEDTGEYEGTDLIFTFSPYAVEKNAHAYDKKGQPTRSGEEVTGWFTLDFNMSQIDWTEDNTSEIVFAEEDEENDTSEISTVLKQADPEGAETDESATDGTTEAASEYATEETAAAATSSEIAAEDSTEAAAAETAVAAATSSETAAESSSEKTDADAETAKDPKDGKDDKDKITAANYPAAVFDDSITVRSGRLDTDLADTDLPRKSKMTVHVEADEGTFPEGTVMVLSAVEDLDAVAEAVGTAVDAKTRGFQAVDITFYDKDPSEEDAKEIEPLKPIRVSIKSDEIKKAAEDASTAPVVVHIEDDNTATEIENTASKNDSSAIEIEKPGVEEENTVPENGSKDKTDKADEGTGNSAQEDEKDKEADEPDAQDHTDLTAGGEDKDEPEATITETGERPAEGNAGPASEDIEDSAEGVTGTNDDTTNDSTKSDDTANDDAADPAAENSSDGMTGMNGGTADDAVDFEADSFSIYAVVYTVDFHWEVDGKTFEFSIPGGGFISFEALMEILGVADTERKNENSENVNSADDPTSEKALTLNNVEISEMTRQFVSDVDKVEFSDPGLVWVGKVDADTTVGHLKEANQLEAEYSGELTEEQIEEINAQTVHAGDWALISMQPFESEEKLTVTMKNEEQFEILVTDAQYEGTKVTTLNNATGALINKSNNNAVLGISRNSNSLQAVGVTVSGDQISTADGSPELTQWTFTYRGNWSGYDHYRIQCAGGYLHLDSGSATLSTSPQDLIVVSRQQNGETQYRIANDNHDALNNTSNNTSNGYSAYNNWGYTTNPGEWFTVYSLSYPDDPWELDGQTRTIINDRSGWLALRDEIDNTKDSRGYYVSGNTTNYTSVDGVDYSSSSDVLWTFEFVSNGSTGAYYRIKTANGYLFIDPNVTRKSDMPSGQSHGYEHALRLESSAGDGSSNDGTLIRVVSNGDGTYTLQNRNGVSLWNYGNNQFWLSTFGEENNNQAGYGKFRLALRPEVHHVTVHYVDREGHILTGVQYTGTNAAVTDNHDGTFTIPYDISENVDLRANFDFTSIGDDHLEYTYANTHLAGDGDYSAYTYEGYLIDSKLTPSSGSLHFSSDSGETSGPYVNPYDEHFVRLDPGNKDYRPLVGSGGSGWTAWTFNSYPLSGTVYNRPSYKTEQITYAESVDKDIYVILDPLPGETAASASGGSTIDADDPELSKTMTPNNDGTYTLSLKVDAHARNVTETNKANVLFVVDTSSSMRKLTEDGSTRIIDTYTAVSNFGNQLLSYNNESRPDAVEVAMITFDGEDVERLDWTKSKTAFQENIDEYLRYYWLHTGTNWEDAMKGALDKLLNDKVDAHPTDNDPTFVVFFTDGEPSQYTNFNGVGENTNTDVTDPITHGTVHDEPDSSYPNFYSYFLSREGAKDEMRAIVDSGAQLYGIYAYNTTNESYAGYNGNEDGAKMLHNAIRYGYNETGSLEDNLFYEAKNTNDLKGAFDKIFNLITEQVGFSNVVVQDGIAAGVTSSTVVEGDVSAFTYIIRDNTGAMAYKVTVAPNGVPAGTTPEPETGTPIFTLRDGTVIIGETVPISTTKIMVDDNGDPVLDNDGKFQTVVTDVDAYYCEDNAGNKYIMPISTTGENVVWDLSPLGLLKDGYSYEVNFVVWPNQDAYDLVADLNNGNPRHLQITENWSDSNPDVKTYTEKSTGRIYKKGGIKEYPYISRYEDNGVYSAMSNTDQSVTYYKFDKKIKDGEEEIIITNGSTTILPPDPMPLTASLSRIEKLWNYQRDPGLFAQYLYNTDGTSKKFKVDFDIFQGDNLTDPYKMESLGWDATANNGQGAYVWAPNDTMTNVTYAGYPHQIGTRWVSDFSIATGLILTDAEMERLGLNKSLYPSTEFGQGSARKTYYILEPGHDYTIKEHQVGTIGYEFDFIAPVYHPMLIDGVLKNVEIQYTYKTNDQGEYIVDEDGNKIIDTATISKISGSDAGLSGLEIENTLRGYINLNKVVVDEDNQRVEDDNTKFEYVIKLDSTTDPGPFKGDHIPWYGVNGLYYNDGHEHYYQVYEAQGGIWMIRTEDNKEYEVTSTGFNPDEAGEQTVTYDAAGHEKEVKLYGNQMTATADGKHATATLAISQNETLYIANIPVGTTYTITEANVDEYYLIDILKEVKNGTAVEHSEHVNSSGLTRREAIGTIVTNRDNHVTYTNQIRTGALQITKTIQKNGTRDTSATGKFYYAVYDEPYDKDADPVQVPVRTGFIDVTTGGTATVTESKLKMGTYYVYELSGEGGTPVISGEGGIFTDGKYYEVTTTGSPATVTEGQTSSVGIVNNYKTIPVTASKTWADKNPQHLTIYFKLFYENAAGVAVTTGTPLKELTYNNMSQSTGIISVTWDDMPRYDENGVEYNYIVREYVLDDTNGEFEEDGHKYMETAPNGYVNTEDGLSVTNSKIETYEPVTTYSGLKLWVDTVNGGKTRPDGLTVTLMIDKDEPEQDVPVLGEDSQPLRPDWVTVGENQWRYTFTKLPMFDNDQKIIKYYAVETPVAGYADSITSHSDTQYVYTTHTIGHTTNDAYPTMNSDADLVYTAVRIQHEGYLHHIWTQRVPTADEKTRLVELVNSDLGSQNLPADATVSNVHWVSGLPIDHEFVYKPQGQGGYKIKLTRYNSNTIHLEVNNHGVFSNICYGTLQYNYTAGSTSFKNELQPVSYNVEKTWGDDVTPPAGAVINIGLQGTVTRKVDPQPEGATEIVYETVQVDLPAAGVTQKIQVTLNGGAEGGDDTAANPWKYTWSGLPPCDKAGNEITYSVQELSYTIGGHTVNLRDFAPSEDTSTPGTTKLTNQIPAFSFDILKIDARTAKPLEGAQFTIQPIEATSPVTTPVIVQGTTPSPSTPETTGESGKVTFSDIPLGYYELEEAHIPDGYIILDNRKFYIRVDTDDVKLLEKVITDGHLSFREVTPGAGGRIILGNIELTKSGKTITFTVENTSGPELPYTGGPGTKLFTILGAMLLVLAAAGMAVMKTGLIKRRL